VAWVWCTVSRSTWWTDYITLKGVSNLSRPSKNYRHKEKGGNFSRTHNNNGGGAVDAGEPSATTYTSIAFLGMPIAIEATKITSVSMRT
jgi:hypothetical protein